MVLKDIGVEGVLIDIVGVNRVVGFTKENFFFLLNLKGVDGYGVSMVGKLGESRLTLFECDTVGSV